MPETLVSIAVILLITGMGWYAFFSFRESYQLNQSIESVLGLLRDARTRTLSSDSGAEYGVRFTETRVTLFKGSFWATENEISDFVLPPVIRISAVNLNGGGSDAVFERLTGKTASGTIEFESRRESSKRGAIQIFASGLVEIQ